MTQHLNDEIALEERTPDEASSAVTPVSADETESLHTVIADQARGRSTGELWTSAVGGGMNALLVWFQFPSLHWLAAGFAGVAAYGAWGLLDRSIRTLKIENPNDPGAAIFLRLLRGAAGVGGWTAAIVAIVGF
ncbi:MAG TPA: hypothetical protein VGM50_07990, partial [Gemmatimonadaceae bacterium]